MQANRGLMFEYKQGSHTFSDQKFKDFFEDFQGPNFEISRTSFLFTSINLPIEMV